jgi:hypothetical protein
MMTEIERGSLLARDLIKISELITDHTLEEEKREFRKRPTNPSSLRACRRRIVVS